MFQFARSDSSAESEIVKAESISRRNHLHDVIVGGLSVCCKLVQDNLPAVAGEMNVHRSVIHRLWNHYQRDLDAGESPQRQMIATCCNVPDAGGH
ncbi:hypothetical protein AVEN_192183-1 [Araneus ventricosus]|uniref:Uncharacterized protein n=1 Tax=Araneus ventricosus TaxID=182803 RepID=A0A4Y2J4E4_ARAVE|nr:hypothetical protein AVEN_192183-1 [Araneus ventricosus]